MANRGTILALLTAMAPATAFAQSAPQPVDSALLELRMNVGGAVDSLIAKIRHDETELAALRKQVADLQAKLKPAEGADKKP